MIRRLKFDQREISFFEFDESLAGIHLDVRYARDDNFLNRVFYPSAHLFLLESIAKDLLRVRDWLKPQGFGLLLFDGYRPWSVTKQFWDLSTPEMRDFLANPETGSAHNRGSAVDLSLFELNSGCPVVMPSGFDEMNERAYRDYAGGDLKSTQARDLLRSGMEKFGFEGIKNEWWHFHHHTRHEWPVMNFTFEEILQAR